MLFVLDQSVVSINGAVNLDDLVTFDMESTLVTNATDETRVHFQEPIGNSPYHICGFHGMHLKVIHYPCLISDKK